MKIKSTETYQTMDVQQLMGEAQKARTELSRQLLDMRMKQSKDTNAVAKTKKRIAVIETYLKSARMQTVAVTK